MSYRYKSIFCSHRHHEQSFTSNRSRSFSIFFLIRNKNLRGSWFEKISAQSYSPIVSPKHVNGISVRHNSVFTAPEYSRDMSMTNIFSHSRQRKLHLPGCYLAPTNSSQWGSLLHRWTVSKGPKLSVRYSTLSEQLWSKSTLGATLVDLQDMIAAWATSLRYTASTVNAIVYITIRSVSW